MTHSITDTYKMKREILNFARSFPVVALTSRQWPHTTPFDAINRVMVQTGHMMKGGTIVDAIIINAPSSTKMQIKLGIGKCTRRKIDWERYIENRKSLVRCKVEHAFRIIKCQFGYKKRYIVD